MTTTTALWNQNLGNTVIVVILLIVLSVIHNHSPEVNQEFDVFYEYTVFGLDTIPLDTIWQIHNEEIVK